MAKRRAKGEGSIYQQKKSGLWIAQLTLPNGNRKSKSSKTQKVVVDWLVDQQSKSRNGVYTTSDQLKLGEFLDSYMEDVGYHTLRRTTFIEYKRLIEQHIKPTLGNIKLVALQPGHIQNLYSKKRKEGLSRRTVQYIHAVIHKALNQALMWELVSRNVADLVDKPRPKKTLFKTWTADEVKQFLEAAKDHLYFPIYLIAATGGLRQGEILGIHKGDVDLENGIIQVRHQLTYIRGEGFTITEPKSPKSIRPVTLPPSTIKVLGEHLKHIEDGLIFTTRSGKPISARNVVRHFKSVIRSEGLPEIRFHDLRHTFATLLLSVDGGVHPKIVQEMLGHSSISLTLDTYSHVIPSLQERTAEKVEKILF